MSQELFRNQLRRRDCDRGGRGEIQHQVANLKKEQKNEYAGVRRERRKRGRFERGRFKKESEGSFQERE